MNYTRYQEGEAPTNDQRAGHETIEDKLDRLLQSVQETRQAVDSGLAEQTQMRRQLHEIKEKLMSLDSSVTDVLTSLTDSVATLTTDLTAFQATAASHAAELQATIDSLTAGDVITAEQIATLQANATAVDSQIVASISPVIDSVRALDATLQAAVTPPTA